MKDQDLMRALGNLPQDMLDEFAEWNENGTPLSGSDAESTAEITRANDAISAKKRDISVTRSRPWTIGVFAVVAACTVVAVSVGGGIISLDKQMQVGSNAGTSMSEQIAENTADEIQTTDEAHTPVPLDEPVLSFSGVSDIYPDVPQEGAVQVIRSMDDMQTLISQTNDPLQSDADIYTNNGINEALFAERDLLYFAVKQSDFSDNMCAASFCGGELADDGTLTLLFSELIEENPPEDFQQYPEDLNCYYFYSVSKDALPDINRINVKLESFYQTDASQENPDYLMSIPQQLTITWENRKPIIPENPEVQVVEQVIGEPFYAWYWQHYSGNDIEVPAGGRLEVLHNAEEAAAYLTNSGQQPKELAEYMNAAWFAGEGEPLMEGDTSCEPHDVIFVGIPAREMPENVISWSYRDGTVTPSGRLHLVCNVMTGSGEQAEKIAYGENFYFFMSVPKGRLPEITEWSVTFDEFHSDAAVYSTEQDGQAHYKDWLMEQPVTESYWAASLCQKYIRTVPDVQPDTVTVQGSRIMHISDTETEASASVLTYKSDAAAEITDVDWEKYDVVQITLPSDDARAAVSITDLAIDADGILSLNYNIGKQEQEYAETGAFSFRLLVPKGTVPPITGINPTTVVYEKSYEPDEDTDEYTFIHKSSGLMTIDISAAK